MNTGKTIWGVVCVATCCAVGLATTFTWTGEGADDDWTTCDNWEIIGQNACYPSLTGDDIYIWEDGSPWDIDLVTEEVDDMYILGDVDFGVESGTPTLTVDQLTLQAPDDAAMSVTISGATIRAQ